VLQWGRAPRSAESAHRGQTPGSRHALQWGRAPRSAERRRCFTAATRSQGFNGAALRGARRGSPPHASPLAHGRASMGPRSEERGESPRPSRQRCWRWLQWGRAPRSAESGPPDPLRLRPRASMGPRSEERGEEADCGGLRSQRIASMGPRSEERGEKFEVIGPVPAGSCFNGAALRGARRGSRVRPKTPAIAELQWGRAPRSAERRDLLSVQRHL